MGSLVEMLEALSSLSRTGWMLRGVPHVLAETVSDHSFWSAVIGYELGVSARRRGVRVNPERVAVIALLHDTAESVIGDIPKTAGISEAKEEAEARALGSLPLSPEAKSLVREFMEGETVEALFARAAEVAATIVRARVYMGEGFERVGEIADNLAEYLRGITEGMPVLREVLAEVLGLEL